MYTFRFVLPSGCINNVSLGKEYLVVHKGLAPDFFEMVKKEVSNTDGDDLAGFVRSSSGEMFPFLFSNKNYITEKGATIERL